MPCGIVVFTTERLGQPQPDGDDQSGPDLRDIHTPASHTGSDTSSFHVRAPAGVGPAPAQGSNHVTEGTAGRQLGRQDATTAWRQSDAAAQRVSLDRVDTERNLRSRMMQAELRRVGL